MMQKLIRDGQVAVLYSPTYGGGWFSWNVEHPEILFDPAIVDLVEKGQLEELQVYVTLKYPNIYAGGLDGLTIAWIPKGTRFIIEEYDGSEKVKVEDTVNWLTA